jgi:hypothetical protein
VNERETADILCDAKRKDLLKRFVADGRGTK